MKEYTVYFEGKYVLSAFYDKQNPSYNVILSNIREEYHLLGDIQVYLKE